MVSNYLVALADLGWNLLRIAGMLRKTPRGRFSRFCRDGGQHCSLGVPPRSRALSRAATLPWLKDTARYGIIAREIRRLYAVLGLYTIRVAQRKGTLHPPRRVP